LHGNGRGLEFFAKAIAPMDAGREEDFLAALSQAEEEIQVNMCLNQIISRLSEEEKSLLERLPVYSVPVPVEGLIRLGLDLAEPEAYIKRLLALSLLEQHWNPHLQTREYQCPTLVGELLEQQFGPPAIRLYSLAADYLLYLFEHEEQCQTLSYIITCHQALQAAERQDEADRLALDYIVTPLSKDGQYQTLLDHWLPGICRSEDKQTRAEALGQTGKQLLHIGSYGTALNYLKQSLEMSREIGDKSGQGATLNNISQIYDARGNYETALNYLKQSLEIMQEIGDKSGQGTTLNNISQIYDAQGDYETALNYLKQSLEIRREIGDKSGQGTTLNNISQIFKVRGDYETALNYLKQSLEI
ncbi:MAG: tetratricopeptide repeat protein, partial [Candidatus Electrothrix sp. EH2]|nr:tetratricopeptide repeat protein [Candidatus Electrothrix sp. EH2]